MVTTMSSSSMRSSMSISPSMAEISVRALVGVLALDLQNFVLDDAQQLALVGQNLLVIGDQLLQLGVLRPRSCRVPGRSGAADACPEWPAPDARSGRSGSIRPSLARPAAVRRCANQRDDLVDVVQGDQQAFQNVAARLGLVQIVLRAAADDVLLMLEVVEDDLLAGRAPSARRPPAPA